MLVAVCVHACAWPLEETSTATSVQSSAAAPLLSCALWSQLPPYEVHGAVHSATLADGRRLWLVDGGSAPGADSAAVLALEVSPTATPCHSTLVFHTAFSQTGVLSEAFATPLDLAVDGTQVLAFYQAWRFEAGQPFGVRTLGQGLARLDAAAGVFIASDHLLWPADRPNYGQSAIIFDGLLYAYGCSATEDGWSRACYVARAHPDVAGAADAWQYFIGSDHWDVSPDLAQPIAVHSGDISVRRHASGRLLATYIAPLDTMVQVRAMLGPTGPFSAAHDLGRCAAAPGEFCTAAIRHPQLEAGTANIALTWSRASFSPLPAGRSWPQLSRPALPQNLP